MEQIWKILSIFYIILFYEGINATGPTSAPNVTIVNTVPPMMAADSGVRIRGPNPRWTSPNQVQQLPTQQIQGLQQSQQPLPAQMQATNQVRQPSQIQIPQTMQNPLQQQQQQQNMLQNQQQQVPQVLNQNPIANNQNPLQSVLQHQQQQPMAMPMATNTIQQAQVQLQGPQQTQAAGQMLINPQQQQMQQSVRPFGAPQGLVNQLNQGMFCLVYLSFKDRQIFAN